MTNDLRLSQRNFSNHSDVIEAVQKLNLSDEQYLLLDRVMRNWRMEKGWLNLEQFRVKWRGNRNAFGLLHSSEFVVITEPDHDRYRIKFTALCAMVAKRSRSVSGLVKTSNTIFKELRKLYQANVGNARIQLDALAARISEPLASVEHALTVLADTSLGIYVNRQPQQLSIVTVNENILHFRTLWAYMLDHIRRSTAWSYSGVFDVFNGNKLDYHGDILAVVPDGADLYKKCMERMQSEPDAAITMSRTLIESTLKWIAHDAGHDSLKNSSMKKLFDACMDAIGHTKDSIDDEIGAVEFASGINQMLTGLAKLRNERSNAHGRKPGQPIATRRHARLAVLSSVALAIYLVEAREAVK